MQSTNSSTPPPRRLAASLQLPLVFDGTKTPVKTALFVIICIAWLLPGLVGHDPWKPEEAIAFGVIYDLLRTGNWIMPSIAGVPYADATPFFAWTGALFGKLFGSFLHLHDAVRLASGFLVAVAMLFVGLAARRLGGERAGRISVLILLGSFGLLLRGHEISVALPDFAGTAIALYGLVRMQRPGPEGRAGAAWFGAGAGIVGLAAGIAPALLLFAIPFALRALVREERSAARSREAWQGLALAFAIALPCMLLWPALMVASRAPGTSWCAAAFGVDTMRGSGRPFEAFYFLRILPWFALPALPVALWIWWRDRKHLRARIELALPLAAFVVLLAGFSVLREPRDDVALPLLLPLILAAVQGLDRLPRGLASFVDWFGMLVFFLIATMLWVGYSAAHTGMPPAAARWVARQTPGFVHEMHWILFAIAAALTLIWLTAALRTRRTNRRAMVNWAAGVTLVWVLVNLLWLPAIDHVRSYRTTANGLKAALPAQYDCVAQGGLGDAQRASFYYEASLKFAPLSEAAQCDFLLVQGVTDKTKDPAQLPEYAAFKLGAPVWEGARPGDKSERFRLYQLVRARN